MTGLLFNYRIVTFIYIFIFSRCMKTIRFDWFNDHVTVLFAKRNVKELWTYLGKGNTLAELGLKVRLCSG